MTQIRFKARSAYQDTPLSVEIFVRHQRYGYTPNHHDGYLEFNNQFDEELDWYAMTRNTRIAQGTALSGCIELKVNEMTGKAEVTLQ